MTLDEFVGSTGGSCVCNSEHRAWEARCLLVRRLLLAMFGLSADRALLCHLVAQLKADDQATLASMLDWLESSIGYCNSLRDGLAAIEAITREGTHLSATITGSAPVPIFANPMDDPDAAAAAYGD